MMTKNYNIIWVGSRESDISDVKNFFSGSITLYGNNSNNNRSLCALCGVRVDNSNPSRLRDDFVYNQIKEVAQLDSSVVFMFYDPNWIREIPRLKEFSDRFICVNDFSLIEKLSNKIEFHNTFENDYSFLKTLTLSLGQEDLLLKYLRERFGTLSRSFVVQRPVANGGHGTYVLTKCNERKLLGELSQGQYLISENLTRNIPVNVHAVLFYDGVLMLAPSVQILLREGAQNYIYRGADYITYFDIPSKMRSSFERQVTKLLDDIRKKGYRGVCGIDAVLTRDKHYFVEMNCRFQGSTSLINKAFSKFGMLSVQQLNYFAFCGESYRKYIACSEAQVDYSCFVINKEKGVAHNPPRECQATANDDMIAIDKDGLDFEQIIDEGRYLYRIIYKKPISIIKKNRIFFLDTEK